jgi:hypothetical protein
LPPEAFQPYSPEEIASPEISGNEVRGGCRIRRYADRRTFDTDNQRRSDPVKYMMFVVADPDAAAEGNEPLEGDPTIDQWVDDLDGRGKRLMGDRLRPISDATTVRVSRGQLLVTDGPFTESKEWIAGFDVLECDDLDEAIAIAARHPQARDGKIELRPFWTDEG